MSPYTRYSSTSIVEVCCPFSDHLSQIKEAHKEDFMPLECRRESQEDKKLERKGKEGEESVRGSKKGRIQKGNKGKAKDIRN